MPRKKPRRKGRTIMSKIKDKTSDFLGDLNAAFAGGSVESKSPTVKTTTKSSTKPMSQQSYKDELRAAYGSDDWDDHYGSTYGVRPTTNSGAGVIHTPGLPAYKKYAGKVMIQLDGKDSFDGPYEVGNSYRDWWDEAIKHYPPTDDTITIPHTHVRFSYASVRFNACVFTATDDYMRARWGRSLHSTDRDWLAEHPLSTDNGVPQEYMVTCVHAMLEPYGMGVSKVRLRRGTLAAGEPLQQFMLALGVNPFAMIDRETSNKQAAEKLGMTEAEADALWRFEFHDEPLPGCTIIAERGWSDGKGVSTGSFGGHARYLAPRAKEGNWAVSVQLAPLELIQYDAPIVSPEYIPRKGDATLTLDSVLLPDKSGPLAVKWRGTFYAPAVAKEKEEKSKSGYKYDSSPTMPGVQTKVETTSQADAEYVTYENGFKKTTTIKSGVVTTRLEPDYGTKGAPSGKAVVTPHKPPFTPLADVISQRSLVGDDVEEVPSQLTLLSDIPEDAVPGGDMMDEFGTICGVCRTKVTWNECSPGTDICNECYDAAWEGLKCPNVKCNTNFALGYSPYFVTRDAEAGLTLFECASKKCKQRVEIRDDAEDRFPKLVTLAKSCPPMDADEFESLVDEYLDSLVDETSEDDASFDHTAFDSSEFVH